MDKGRARLLAVAAGAFPSLDTSVNVAFPAIDEHFSLDVADLQWIVVAYLFTYAVLLVPAGRVGDRVGHGRLVLAGALISLLGVAGCAAAPSYVLFLAARVIQGIGTAMLYAGAPALLTTTAGRGARGVAVSWFQAASMIGLMAGPAAGGLLVEALGWRSVYWYRVPIAAALALLAFRASRVERVPNSSPATRRLGPLLSQPRIRRANRVNTLANAAMFPTWFLVPSLLVDELGLSVIAAGAILAASPALSAVGSLMAGRRLNHVGSEDRATTQLTSSGLALLVLGLALLAMLGPAGSTFGVIAGTAIVGAGIGTFSVPNMHVVMGSLPLDHQGVAAGLSVMMRSLGVVAGVLAAGAIFDSIEPTQGFDAGFRIVFAIATALALCALAISRPRGSGERECTGGPCRPAGAPEPSSTGEAHRR